MSNKIIIEPTEKIHEQIIGAIQNNIKDVFDYKKHLNTENQKTMYVDILKNNLNINSSNNETPDYMKCLIMWRVYHNESDKHTAERYEIIDRKERYIELYNAQQDAIKCGINFDLKIATPLEILMFCMQQED